MPETSLQEKEDNYKHIELDDTETREAILNAKIVKEKRLQQKALEDRAAKNRRKFVSTDWAADVTKAYLLSTRAQRIFPHKDRPGDTSFKLDKFNTVVFELLCNYFSNDDRFVKDAEIMGINNPSLNKGIFLTGNFGVGKTWLMRLFQQNKRQVYHVYNAKKIADDYRRSTDKDPFDESTYTELFKNAFGDLTVFEQPVAGICFDDLGTEDIKNNFGNKSNVLGDLIEMRYAKGNCGVMMHATTNFTADQLYAFYGDRVVDRMKETLNFIELPGDSRRK